MYYSSGNESFKKLKLIYRPRQFDTTTVSTLPTYTALYDEHMTTGSINSKLIQSPKRGPGPKPRQGLEE